MSEPQHLNFRKGTALSKILNNATGCEVCVWSIGLGTASTPTRCPVTQRLAKQRIRKTFRLGAVQLIRTKRKTFLLSGVTNRGVTKQHRRLQLSPRLSLTRTTVRRYVFVALTAEWFGVVKDFTPARVVARLSSCSWDDRLWITSSNRRRWAHSDLLFSLSSETENSKSASSS